jgi:Fe2+ transport system protein FeoA
VLLVPNLPSVRLDLLGHSGICSHRGILPQESGALQVSLADLRIGESAIIRRLGHPRQVAVRLMEYGMVPGTTVTLVGFAPAGDPMQLRLRNYSLAIRRSEALDVEVE